MNPGGAARLSDFSLTEISGPLAQASVQTRSRGFETGCPMWVGPFLLGARGSRWEAGPWRLALEQVWGILLSRREDS
jgi:hypothetical protein